MSRSVDEDGGYEAFCAAIDDGDPFYLVCPDGHGSVPPRRVCPDCGAHSLSEEPLPDVGRVQAHTVVQVAPPAFVDRVPYVTAIADFGPVTLTGLFVGVDPDAVEHGMAVTVTAEDVDGRRATTLGFEPV